MDGVGRSVLSTGVGVSRTTTTTARLTYTARVPRRWASVSANPAAHKERIVILGSGWAGYAAARTLSAAKSRRILISPRSHFAFTPLLASTSVGTLEFRAALEPVRRLGLDEFHQGWASAVDFRNKLVRVDANEAGDVSAATNRPQTKGPAYTVPYDKLIVAVGCHSQTFGIEGVPEHANFLRDVGDARAIRLRILQIIETANLPTTTDAERARLLHFVVVGGGPTGIEFAGELHDLLRDDVARMYPELVRHFAITVYDIAPKVLPMFGPELAAYATDTFRRQGIRVKTQRRLTRLRRDGRSLMIRIDGEDDEVPAGIVVWSTGLTQNPLIKTLVESPDPDGQGRSIAKDARTGGIVTNASLQVQLQGPTQQGELGGDGGGDGGTTTTTLKDVYATGDCASVQGSKYPATAQVAAQQAVYLAKQLNSNQDGPDSRPFRFHNWGVMTYLGGWRAIHQSTKNNLKGWAAWVLWRSAYLTRSMSFRNRIMIPVYWSVTYLFGRDISRF